MIVRAWVGWTLLLTFWSLLALLKCYHLFTCFTNLYFRPHLHNLCYYMPLPSWIYFPRHYSIWGAIVRSGRDDPLRYLLFIMRASIARRCPARLPLMLMPCYQPDLLPPYRLTDFNLVQPLHGWAYLGRFAFWAFIWTASLLFLILCLTTGRAATNSQTWLFTHLYRPGPAQWTQLLAFRKRALVGLDLRSTKHPCIRAFNYTHLLTYSYLYHFRASCPARLHLAHPLESYHPLDTPHIMHWLVITLLYHLFYFTLYISN